jgi:hypothetical protein
MLNENSASSTFLIETIFEKVLDIIFARGKQKLLELMVNLTSFYSSYKLMQQE